MSPDQVREIVRMTVDELIQRKVIDIHNYSSILRVVDKKLYQFFNNKGDGNGISYVLNQLSDDPYIDIIFLQYRDGKTIEWIAEYMDKDESTIKRNKKRLIMQIYKQLEEVRK